MLLQRNSGDPTQALRSYPWVRTGPWSEPDTFILHDGEPTLSRTSRARNLRPSPPVVLTELLYCG